MGVYIPTVEMPRNCWECRFCDWDETDDILFSDQLFCEITGKKIETEYKALSERLPDCPLVEIPVPHGALKDVDAILNEPGNCFELYGHDKFFRETILQNALTVIEAEGKGGSDMREDRDAADHG